jgi:tagatose 6-phosphate kinase
VILAAGLTPAWQQILEFDEFQTGRVNRARSVQSCASGKVLNVGRALHSLGAPQQTLSVVGSGTGELIASDLARLDIAARLIESKQPTRVCTTILDRSTMQTTELVENSARLSADVLEQYREAFRDEVAKADFAVVSGSLPEETPAGFYRDLIADSGSRTILDARGPELIEALAIRPLLVKPNRSELEITLQRRFPDDAALLEGMREIIRLGAKWVVVSDGANALWAVSEDSVERFIPTAARVVNPIGCGDCLAAGIATALWEGRGIAEAVRFGMAAAADNLEQLLPSGLDRARVDRFVERLL